MPFLPIKIKPRHYSSALLMLISCLSYGHTQNIPLTINGSFSTKEAPCRLQDDKTAFLSSIDFGNVDLKNIGDSTEGSVIVQLSCSSINTTSISFSSEEAKYGNGKYYKTSNDDYGVEVIEGSAGTVKPGETMRFNLLPGLNSRSIFVKLVKIHQGDSNYSDNTFSLVGSFKIDYQ
ncbi:hypothetical protein A3Q29_21805 [Providencia stuartii]|uniref:Fimbrial protein n=1 Tax=Providencia stuartii TaxID=588 RepID=A0A1S1HK54_PROST|nr:hypothetical protein A3Q29_21805 [Providencia stuartii]